GGAAAAARRCRRLPEPAGLPPRGDGGAARVARSRARGAAAGVRLTRALPEHAPLAGGAGASDRARDARGGSGADSLLPGRRGSRVGRAVSARAGRHARAGAPHGDVDGARALDRVGGAGGALVGVSPTPARARRVAGPRRGRRPLILERLPVSARPAADRLPAGGRPREGDAGPARAGAFRRGRGEPRPALARGGIDSWPVVPRLPA